MRRRVGPRGQVVIPKDLRRHLGVEPGSQVIFEVRGEEVVMKPGKAPENAVEEYVSVITSKLKTKIQLDSLIEEEAIEEIVVHRQ